MILSRMRVCTFVFAYACMYLNIIKVYAFQISHHVPYLLLSQPLSKLLFFDALYSTLPIAIYTPMSHIPNTTYRCRYQEATRRKDTGGDGHLTLQFFRRFPLLEQFRPGNDSSRSELPHTHAHFCAVFQQTMRHSTRGSDARENAGKRTSNFKPQTSNFELQTFNIRLQTLYYKP